MWAPRVKHESGYVLILLLIALMGFGGIVAANFTQNAKKAVDREKFLHNKRVLAEAKNALLQYAYNYPTISADAQGPGRLPCADVDNDGESETDFASCTSLGRLPWAEPALNLYDIRDADGQRLWYAVSRNFATNVAGGTTVNSDPLVTFGTISLRDQLSDHIYNAAVVGDGIVAVVIAPGAITGRNGVPQDRSVANGDDPFDYEPLDNSDEDTDPGILDPVNYLDTLFGVEDNAVFFQDTANGFILGRVDDLAAASVLVNDQLVFITAEEIIEVAEKSALQSYRAAIGDYNARMAALGADVYPWLDDYSTTNLATYEGDIGTRLGRIPSMFGEYFVNTNPGDSEPVRSPLTLSLNVDGFQFDETVPASVAPDIFFRQNGNLSTSFDSGKTIVRYFWDGHDSNLPSSPADGVWEPCPVVTGTEEDCNQDGANNFIGGTNSVDWMKVRIVTVTFTGGSPYEIPFGDLLPNPLGYNPPDAANHASVTAGYNNNSLSMSFNWTQDNDFQSSFAEFPAGNNGTFLFDGADSFTVTLDYYPSLPRWAIAAEDDWHDSIQFVYASTYQPGAGGVCTPGVNCIQVNNILGNTNDKAAVLILAGEHDLVDDDFDGFDDELGDIFDPENDNADDILDARVVNGNDRVLVVRD